MSGLHRRCRLYLSNKYDSLSTFARSKWISTFGEAPAGVIGIKRAVTTTLSDFSQYLRLSFKRIANNTPSSDLSGLSGRDLRLLRTVPKDMLRLGPLLIAIALPGTIFLLPIFLAFPRLLLTRKFWTPIQKADIDSVMLERRLLSPSAGLMKQLTLFIRPVINQPETVSVRKDCNSSTYDFATERHTLSTVLTKLANAETPTDNEVVQLAPLFSGPLTLRALNRHHITLLCAFHGIAPHRDPSPTRTSFYDGLTSKFSLNYQLNRLERLSHFILAEDIDLLKTLSSNSALPDDELLELCLLRGINGYRMNAPEMSILLRRWAVLSRSTDENNYSFRLHLPYLLNFKKYIS